MVQIEMTESSTSAPLLYETHMHTPLCKHAIGEPEEYAAVAKLRGLKGIVVTCHNPAPGGWSPRTRMELHEFPRYLEIVARAREEFAGQVDVRLGLESDFHPDPDLPAYLEKLHARAPFNYILGSVHSQMQDYQERYMTDDPVDYQKLYFEHLALAAESGLFDSLAHPDLVKNVFPSRWNPRLILDDIRRALDRIAKTGVAMELNTSGLHKDVQEMNPGRLILEQMFARGIPIIVGADAHLPRRVGADFELALATLAEVGYTHTSIFLERRRREIPITQALKSLMP